MEHKDEIDASKQFLIKGVIVCALKKEKAFLLEISTKALANNTKADRL